MNKKRRTFLKRAGIVTLGTTATGGGTLLYSWRLEPGWVEVTTTTVHLSRLDKAFAGYRIVQLSDLHVDGTWMDKERLSAIVEMANAQNPDLIVITGDFVTRIQSDTGTVLSVLRDLHSKDGIFGILGNHDHWSDAEAVRGFLRENSIRELNDQYHTLRRDQAMLHLVGMDDLWPHRGEARPVWEHQDRLTTLLKQLPEPGAAILLVHEPDFADVAAASDRISLQLSGHSHGGQVRLPLRGALVVPPLGRKYIAGLYTVQSMLHYTSRGLGMVSPQVRLNCRPEIVVFDCQPA